MFVCFVVVCELFRTAHTYKNLVSLGNLFFYILILVHFLQTGLSPLAPGQWKGFLAVYSGFWVFNNVIRPLRATAAVAVSPLLERWVRAVQHRLRVKQSVAVLITVLMLNVVGTITLMCAGIACAAVLAGVPVFPLKPV